MENGKQPDKAKIYDIHCPSCGAPAYYDIKSLFYRCHYCDGKVQVSKALVSITVSARFKARR